MVELISFCWPLYLFGGIFGIGYLLWKLSRKGVEGYVWPAELKQIVDEYREVVPKEWRFADKVERYRYLFDLKNEAFFCYRLDEDGTYEYQEVFFEDIVEVEGVDVSTTGGSPSVHRSGRAYLGPDYLETTGTMGPKVEWEEGGGYFRQEGLGFFITVQADDEEEEDDLPLFLATNEVQLDASRAKFNRLRDLFEDLDVYEGTHYDFDFD